MAKWGKQRGPTRRTSGDSFRKPAKTTGSAAKPGAAVYRSWKWRKLSKQMRKEHPYCSKCGTPEDLTVDHKVGLREMGPKPELNPLAYDRRNLVVLCRPCHSALEIERRKQRKKQPSNASMVDAISKLDWLND